MSELVNQLWAWMHAHVAYLLVMLVISVVVMVASLWICRWVLVSVRPDYFNHRHQPFEQWRGSRPALWWTLMISKNLLGGLLIVAGLVMFVTPGQGIITLILGLVLIDAPGKHELVRRIIVQPRVLRAINLLREGAGQPPLEFD